MKKLVLLCAAVLAAMTVSPAYAEGLHLDKVIVNFSPSGKPLENINVTNQSGKTLKVTVNTVEVTDSDLPGQKEAPTEKLVAAPKSFEIAAGETRAVRLVLRGFPDDLEAIYRVRFAPDQPTMQQTQESGGTSVQVNVIVSMGALIMVAPKNPKPDLRFTREGGKIAFTNAGNVTAQLQREDFCTEKRKLCVPLEGRRIFPGASWEMDIPEQLKAMAFTQTVLINGSFSTLSYPAP